MTLKFLQEEMISAMKAKDKERKEVLSSLIGSIKNAAINKNCRNDIPEELINEVLIKELKVFKEMLDTCPKDRKDLLAIYEIHYNIIASYAPKLIDNKEDLLKLLKDNNFELTKNNRGKIMKFLKGKADLSIANKVLNEILI